VVSLIPSFILKGERAEKHLRDLKAEIAKWSDTHPYEVRATHYGKRDVYHLRFTAAPPPEIGMIAADFVYNIRSGLDHLQGALVPSRRRDKVYFPIYFYGVWEDAVPGEDAERTKDRGRWKSDTEKVRPEAVAILKALQPLEAAGQLNTFRVINILSNRDRHREMPVVFSGLTGARLLCRDAHGERVIGPADTGNPILDRMVAKDGAELGYPEGAMDMNIVGAPVVAIEISSDQENVVIPEAFDLALSAYRERAVGALAPYVHRRGHR
jgi:hypothetical protein